MQTAMPSDYTFFDLAKATSYVRKYVPANDRDDVTQDAYLRWHSAKGDSRMAISVLSACHNAVTNYYRERGRERHRIMAYLVARPDRCKIAVRDTTQAIRELEPNDKDLGFIVRSLASGHTQEEVAKSLGCTQPYIAKRVRHLRENYAAAMDTVYDGPETICNRTYGDATLASADTVLGLSGSVQTASAQHAAYMADLNTMATYLVSFAALGYNLAAAIIPTDDSLGKASNTLYLRWIANEVCDGSHI